jgi:hypothetical protein
MKNLPPEVAIQHFMQNLSDKCSARALEIQAENRNVEKRLAMLLTLYHHAITKLSKLQQVNSTAIKHGQTFYINLIKHI